MAKWWVAFAGIIIVILVAVGYRAFYRPVPPPDETKIEALQAEIAKLHEGSATAKAEMEKAKENAQKALERSRVSQARADALSTQAAQWKSRYEEAAREREKMAQAKSGAEAVRELRAMGWVR